MTALMIAAADGRSGIVRILLEFHASVTITDQVFIAAFMLLLVHSSVCRIC